MYKVIYELIDEVRAAMVGLLPPTVTEEFQGRAEVRETFTVPKIGTIAGCYVSEGKVFRSDLCRLVRDGVQIYEGKLGSLKRFKDDARDVASGFECGIGIEGYNDVKIGDMIETYKLSEKPPTLE
jgi:translation initiation factor IF-2